MEDTLWVNKSAVEVNEKCVLILVLMEDTLWGDLKMLKEAEYES